jgi:hypothetical protein
MRRSAAEEAYERIARPRPAEGRRRGHSQMYHLRITINPSDKHPKRIGEFYLFTGLLNLCLGFQIKNAV